MALSRNDRRWLVAGIIAAVGWAAGIAILVLAPPAEDDPLGEYTASKQYEAGVERIGGKSAVLGAELNETIASWFQGTKLGYTIGITSVFVSLIYLGWTSDRFKAKG